MAAVGGEQGVEPLAEPIAQPMSPQTPLAPTSGFARRLDTDRGGHGVLWTGHATTLEGAAVNRGTARKPEARPVRITMGGPPARGRQGGTVRSTSQLERPAAGSRGETCTD